MRLGVIFSVILQLFGGVILLGLVCYLIWGENEPYVPTDADLCISTAIEWAGLSMCASTPPCSLDDFEQYRMYQLFKQGLMSCGREVSRLELVIPTIEIKEEESLSAGP